MITKELYYKMKALCDTTLECLEAYTCGESETARKLAERFEELDSEEMQK